MQECLSPHPVMHTLTGLGLGLVAANMVPTLSTGSGISFGLVLIAGGLLGEFLVSAVSKKVKGKR